MWFILIYVILCDLNYWSFGSGSFNLVAVNQVYSIHGGGSIRAWYHLLQLAPMDVTGQGSMVQIAKFHWHVDQRIQCEWSTTRPSGDCQQDPALKFKVCYFGRCTSKRKSPVALQKDMSVSGFIFNAHLWKEGIQFHNIPWSKIGVCPTMYSNAKSNTFPIYSSDSSLWKTQIPWWFSAATENHVYFSRS